MISFPVAFSAVANGLSAPAPPPPAPSSPATLGLSGPSTAVADFASANFTVTVVSGTFGGIITPTSDTVGTTFSPACLFGPGTFTMIAPDGISGTNNVSLTNNVGASNGSAVPVTVSLPPVLDVSGPSTGTNTNQSSNFTAVMGYGAFTGTLTLVSDVSGDTFQPATLTAPGTFKITPVAVGTRHITFSNSGMMLVNPTSLTYTSNLVVPTISWTGPNTGTVGVATSAYTVTASNFTGVITFHSASGGTFSPATLTGLGTTTFTPSTAGTYDLSITNTGGATNPPNISITVAPAPVVISVSPTSGTGLVNTPVTFTLSISGTFTGTINYNSSLSATFVPTSRTSAGTFTFTPTTVGSHTITFTNTGGATNPQPVSFIATA